MANTLNSPKKTVIMARPNGVGKTTFVSEFLPNEAGCPEFINVDLIAAGLSPFAPETVAVRAGRLMLQEIRRRTRRGVSFAYETTPEWARLCAVDSSLADLELPREAHFLEPALGRVGRCPCGGSANRLAHRSTF